MKRGIVHKSRSMRIGSTFLAIAAASVGVMVGGCGPGEDDYTATRAPVVNIPPDDQLLPNVDAGVKPLADVGPEGTVAIAKTMPFLIRTDPFALLRQETAYEASQRAERLVAEGGYLTVWSPPPPPPASPPQVQAEPQPYRRLSGILIGDSVLAIVEMEDGKTYIIRPGMQIPNSEWTVVSLDSEKAVLRRAGNRRPTQITVRLESPPAGRSTGQNNQPGGGQPGAGQGQGNPQGGKTGIPGLGPAGAGGGT
jgi:hypothetical protein